MSTFQRNGIAKCKNFSHFGWFKYSIINFFVLFTRFFFLLDKVTSYRDYVFNLERLTVYVSNRPRLDSPEIDTEQKCSSVSRANNALFHTRLRLECPDGVKGRYLYIQSTPVPNRWDRIFNTILCEVYVY